MTCSSVVLARCMEQCTPRGSQVTDPECVQACIEVACGEGYGDW